ncbi:hypothetical protein [Neosynechococcus sphagnicola]|nr:hypothetical protein [Neosynechococcus sphagnicola]
MNLKHQLAASAIAIAAVTSPLLPAQAEIVTFKTADGAVGIVGLSEYGSYRAEFAGVPRSRSISASPCGIAKISDSDSYPMGATIKIAGTTHTVASLPSGPSPVCKDGQLTTSPVATVSKNSEGDIFVGSLTPYGSVEVTYPNLPSGRSLKASACGMLVIKPTDAYPIGTSSIVLKTASESPTTVVTISNPSSLTAKVAPICSKGIAYYPTGWD